MDGHVMVLSKKAINPTYLIIDMLEALQVPKSQQSGNCSAQ